MNVYANIDDCAIIINDFLPEGLFKKVSEYNYEKLNLEKNVSSKHWEKDLYLDEKKNITMREVNTVNKLSSLSKGKFLYEDKIFKEVLDVVKKCEFMPFKTNSTVHLSYYKYNKYAGINWHNDGNYTLNYSLYIHKEWDRNWGGETLIDTGRGLPLSVYSKPNSLVAIKNNVMHKVCAITGPKERKVLQLRGVFHE